MRSDATKQHILVADDQPDVLRALRMLLADAGYDVNVASSPGAVLESTRRQRFDLLLLDLNYARNTTSGDEGVELLQQLRPLDVPIVVMTAFASIEIAVRAMREGARDLLEKPWDNYRLLNVVAAQLDISHSRRRERALGQSLTALQNPSGALVVAHSKAMRELLEVVERVSGTDAAILLTGENGVGKGVVAAALHQRSGRTDQTMITVDLGTLSGGLVEAELFGHEAGAFTDARGERIGRFELADGGTLLLDEIANCPIEQQSKLLRVIESGEFERLGSSTTRRTDVRLLCATNADLRVEVEAGRFRRDLYYRINTIELNIPPLRERRDDILALAQHFLERFRSKYRRTLAGFDSAAEAALLACPWPGNVRELAHTVERAVLLTAGPRIGASDLRLDAVRPANELEALARMTLDEAEKHLISRALERVSGNVREAARALGLSRSALYRRLERHGISGQDDGSDDS